jgi:RNase P subunit RPR2
MFWQSVELRPSIGSVKFTHMTLAKYYNKRKGLQIQLRNDKRSICHACRAIIKKGMEIVRVTRTHANKNTAYHRNCYVDAKGSPML